MIGDSISQLLENITENVVDNISRSNEATGVSDTSLNDAITTLIEGYGHGEPDITAVSLKTADGSIFQTYTLSEFTSLLSYPTPTKPVEHCTFDGWCMPLQDAKNYLLTNNELSVYPKYRPTVDKTYIDVSLSYNTLNVQVGVTIFGKYVVDWGDGSSTSTVQTSSTGTNHNLKNTTWWSPTHRYQSTGNYTITIVATPDTGTTATLVGVRYCAIDVSQLGTKVEKNNATNNIINSIVLGGNITKIGDSAFASCENLMQVILPEGTTDICANAFFGCKKLKGIALPNSLLHIGSRAFYACNGLNDIFIPQNVTTIDDYAFAYCNELKHYVVSSANSVVSSINECLVHNGTDLICGCNLSEIPTEITNIHDGAFYGLTKITQITVPTGVLQIGKYAFYRCISLNQITIPNTVKDIGENAFNGCIELKSAILPNNNSYKTIKGNLFKDCITLKDVSVQSNATVIKSGAFENCVRLEAISLPDGMDVFPDAFKNCLSLGSQDDVFIVNQYIIKANRATNYVIPDTINAIAREAFSGCKTLASVQINSDSSELSKVGMMAFCNCENLTSVDLHYGHMTILANSLFYNCSSLEKVQLPTTISKLDNTVFYNCPSLTTFGFGDDIGEDDTYIDTNITSLGEGTFYNSNLINLYYNPNITSNVPRYMFYNCKGLVTVNIASSIKSIATHAFYDCNNIEQISLPATLERVYNYVFYHLNKSVEVFYEGTLDQWCRIIFDALHANPTGRSLEQIANGKITNLYIGNQLLVNATIPDTVSELLYTTFYGVTSLKSVTLPTTITKIGARCFENCTELSSLTYQGTVSQWGQITKSSNWKTNTQLTIVYCSDGNVVL